MAEAVDYVLLHGGVQGGWVWDEMVAALAAQTGGAYGRVLALDIPGCGAKRGRDTVGLGPDEVARELAREIETSGMRDILLVGHSQAGTVLPRLVQRLGGLLRRVVYVSCIAPQPGETVLTYRRSLPDGPGTPPDWSDGGPPDPFALFRTMFCSDMTEAQTEAFLARLGQDAWPEAMMQSADWTYDGLAETPATYVELLADATIPPAWQRIFAGRFGAQRIVRIDAGHQAMLTRPHALAETLRIEARG
jgi:pimeloyl-ACP methyl ester carboxylesterase